MLRRSLLVGSFVVFLLSSTNAKADVVNVYQFSGDNGLTGSFTLDTSVGFTIADSMPVGTSYESMSPLDQLSGSLGAFTFSGGDMLFIFTSTDVSGSTPSMWTLRAGGPVLPPISGNTVGGRTVTGVNLFVANELGSVPPTFTPSFAPSLGFTPGYAVVFSDGTFESGSLQTFQLVGTTSVPEPTSLVFLAISLAAIWVARSRFFPVVIKRLEKGEEPTYPAVGRPIPSDVLRAMRMMRRYPTKFPQSSPVSSEVPVKGRPRGR